MVLHHSFTQYFELSRRHHLSALYSKSENETLLSRGRSLVRRRKYVCGNQRRIFSLKEPIEEGNGRQKDLAKVDSVADALDL